jgi:hypothetical protein
MWSWDMMRVVSTRDFAITLSRWSVRTVMTHVMMVIVDECGVPVQLMIVGRVKVEGAIRNAYTL